MFSAGPSTITTAVSNYKLDSTSLLTTSLHSNTLSFFPGSFSIHNHPSMFSSSTSLTSPPTEALHHRSLVSPLCQTLTNQTSMSNLGWTYLSTTMASLTVQDWLKNLRLHKYSETFQGKSFNEVKQFWLQLSI